MRPTRLTDPGFVWVPSTKPNGRADRIIVWLSVCGLVLLTVGISLGWF
jgi:hypothetical protein